MAEIKNAIDKTEELARKIWLAGLGAYGHGLNNIQEGYEKMSDSTRRYFDDLVERGTKIEADAKTKLDEAKSKLDKTGDKLKEAGDKLKAQSEKLKAQGEKLKIQGKNLNKETVKANITTKVDEIRGKVSSKLTMPTMPTLPSFGKEEKLTELSGKLDELIAAVSALVAKEPEAEKPAPAPKKTTRKAAPKAAEEKPVTE